MLQGCRATEALIYWQWEGKIMQPLWDIVWHYLKKLNVILLHNKGIPHLAIYQREMKTYTHTKAYTWLFTYALWIIIKNWEQPKCPSTDEWTFFKIWHIQTMDYYSEIKSNYWCIQDRWTSETSCYTKEARYKNYTLYSFTFKKFLGKAKL